MAADDAKAGPPAKPKPHYHGHRDRLRQRLLSSGVDALPDYELLEMVLWSSNPRGDTKPLAKALLDRFGDFAHVVSASPELLREVKGVGDGAIASIKTIQAAGVRLAKAKVMNKTVLTSWNQLIEYCTASMAYLKTEQFRVLYLDRKNVLIADEMQQQGTVDHTPVYPREVVKRALQLDASAIIMVHNHPSGDPTPSGADVEMTRAVKATVEAVGIKLHDHVVIGKDQHVSFREFNFL